MNNNYKNPDLGNTPATLVDKWSGEKREGTLKQLHDEINPKNPSQTLLGSNNQVLKKGETEYGPKRAAFSDWDNDMVEQRYNELYDAMQNDEYFDRDELKAVETELNRRRRAEKKHALNDLYGIETEEFGENLKRFDKIDELLSSYIGKTYGRGGGDFNGFERDVIERYLPYDLSRPLTEKEKQYVMLRLKNI